MAKKPPRPSPCTPANDPADAISAYTKSQPAPSREMCDTLCALIDAALPDATSQIWHGSPVWFIKDNPVVGYEVKARSVNLLFWNGRVIDETGLAPVGKHGAAQAVFSSPDDLNEAQIRRWLKKARDNVFDSKAYFKALREKGMST